MKEGFKDSEENESSIGKLNNASTTKSLEEQSSTDFDFPKNSNLTFNNGSEEGSYEKNKSAYKNDTQQNQVCAEDYNIDPQYNNLNNYVNDNIELSINNNNGNFSDDEYSWGGEQDYQPIINDKTIFIGSPRTKSTSWWLIFTIVLGVYFVTSLFIFNIVLMPVRVEGASMEPTIHNNVGNLKYDIVYLNRTQNVGRNDIVVVDATHYSSDANAGSYIKRAVAVAGDTIQFVKVSETKYWVRVDNTYERFKVYGEYKLYINGEPANEDYITSKSNSILEILSYSVGGSIYTENEYGVKEEVDTSQIVDESGVMLLMSVSSEDFYNNHIITGEVMTVPEGCLFVLGDNRTISNDSKYFGFVQISDIIGVVAIHRAYDSGLIPAIIYSIQKGYLF